MLDTSEVWVFMGETPKGEYGLSVSESAHDVWHSTPFEKEEHARDLAATVWEFVKKYCSDPEMQGDCSLGDYLDGELEDCFATDEDDHIMDLGQTQLY